MNNQRETLDFINLDNGIHCQLTRDHKRGVYIMDNGKSTHEISTSETSAERLAAHWEGFKSNASKIPAHNFKYFDIKDSELTSGRLEIFDNDKAIKFIDRFIILDNQNVEYYLNIFANRVEFGYVLLNGVRIADTEI